MESAPRTRQLVSPQGHNLSKISSKMLRRHCWYLTRHQKLLWMYIQKACDIHIDACLPDAGSLKPPPPGNHRSIIVVHVSVWSGALSWCDIIFEQEVYRRIINPRCRRPATVHARLVSAHNSKAADEETAEKRTAEDRQEVAHIHGHDAQHATGQSQQPDMQEKRKGCLRNPG